MRAFLLAGGLGERLRPLTLSRPKCLVPINGVPLLRIWLDHCQAEGITDVLLNVSQHPELVRSFLERRTQGPRVRLVIESSPLGTAGTVRANRDFVEGEESFWVFYSDNLTDLSLDPMRAAHARHGGLLTMALFHAPVPTAAGIVQVQDDGRIVRFDEKPEHPAGDLANAGIYLARAGLLDAIPETGGLVDFGNDVLPHLLGRMYGHVIKQFLMDIGTPDALAAASAAWARLGARGHAT